MVLEKNLEGYLDTISWDATPRKWTLGRLKCLQPTEGYDAILSLWFQTMQNSGCNTCDEFHTPHGYQILDLIPPGVDNCWVMSSKWACYYWTRDAHDSSQVWFFIHLWQKCIHLSLVISLYNIFLAIQNIILYSKVIRSCEIFMPTVCSTNVVCPC